MCPGRNFAKGEIKSIVAGFLCDYEIRFANGSATKRPGMLDNKSFLSFGVPESDIEIEIRARTL